MPGCNAGLIITVASAGGIFPMPMAPVYATAKSGVIHFTRSLAPRLKKRNIRICALCPQQVDTPMVSHHQHFLLTMLLRIAQPFMMLLPVTVAHFAVVLCWLSQEQRCSGTWHDTRCSNCRIQYLTRGCLMCSQTRDPGGAALLAWMKNQSGGGVLTTQEVWDTCLCMQTDVAIALGSAQATSTMSSTSYTMPLSL